MRKINFNNKGFTLFELLIVMALVSVVGVLLIQILIQNNGVYYDQTTKVSQGLNVNDTYNQIEKDIRTSGGVVASLVDGEDTYTTSSNIIVLKIPSIDSSGSIISDTYDHLIIYEDGANNNFLMRKIIPNAISNRVYNKKVLLTNLSYLQFQYLDNSGSPISAVDASKINFIFNIKTAVGLNNQESSASGKVNLRNN